MRYREFARRLTARGCVELPRRGGGSHRKWFNPAANRSGTIPDWGGKDLNERTIRSALRQLGLDPRDFFPS
ncbi:MAG: type II toxin-antitoxin system HicA family toxin [Chloroflexota bacterium]|nr:type II toxin-antitoxin system HicA family toxin [Chloroflexota bacterium]MDE2900345.1 type II toxin-antitoxin system HicA family toxin [Chloroflexota bacterium]MDE2968628.1 type II toxin-antitoxin system HicA family toxin [Chloroflexota bacterium]